MYDDDPDPLGASHPNWAPYDVFLTSDEEWVFVGPSSQRQWEALCEVLAVPFADDERFETLTDRRENIHLLTELLADEFREFEADDVVERLREAGVPTAHVNDLGEVVSDPHLAATDALTPVSTAEGDDATVDVPRFPVTATGFDRIESTGPPTLGEDSTAVLGALGYSEERIERLRDAGVI
ncbi:CoA transferase [Halomarina salina]|uniref:CoA transferase n=1 Tax=Halomarina salina TaxID=1872699 RepID=A0ABD5RHV5_9EURY